MIPVRGWLPWGLCLFLLGGTACQSPVRGGATKLVDRITAYKSFVRPRDYWPTQGWKRKKPSETGMKEEALKKAMLYAFARTGDEKDRKGIRTDGVVVIHKGYLVHEQYARNYKASTSHLSWSVSKSFVNALFGIAEQKGLLKRSDKASSYFKGLGQGEASKVTIQNLLNMASGLCWNEGYEASPLKSTVIKMLYTAGREDMAQFAVKQGMCFPAGTRWYYSSGSSNLLMGILREAVTPAKYEAFVWKELFDRIGMKQVTWERDGSGNFVGSSYLHAPPRELAKFGYLYLNDGVWEGKRLFPKDWVAFTTTSPRADPRGVYGAHWWLNVGRPRQKIGRRFPDAPADTFLASGHWGQYIFVIPSRDLVVVRVGDDRDKSFRRNTFLKLVLASLKANKTSE